MSHRIKANVQIAAALTLTLMILIISCPLLRGQSADADWEKAAGGKMSFDVASVKRTTVFVPNGLQARPRRGSGRNLARLKLKNDELTAGRQGSVD